MPSQAELDAAFSAVRALVDARAGWYAAMITDDMVREVVRDALTAVAKVCGHMPSPVSPPPKS